MIRMFDLMNWEEYGCARWWSRVVCELSGRIVLAVWPNVMMIQAARGVGMELEKECLICGVKRQLFTCTSVQRRFRSRLERVVDTSRGESRRIRDHHHVQQVMVVGWT